MAALRLALLAALLALAAADLRQASQPRNNWTIINRGHVRFVANATNLYMEPSDFGYEGLKRQRDDGAYDQFLRSNIDNEQDKRNFDKEPGRDHLPFRSYEGTSTDAGQTSVQTKIPATAPGPAIYATPGVPIVMPIRWNNPHSSELEVNVWISNNQYVVPIRKPTCSGEGYADNVFDFTIPNDFNALAGKVPGWTGCKRVGDCVLQVYAHSVESRTYAIGTPLIVSGTVTGSTSNTNQILQAFDDVGTNITKLPRDLCLPSLDPTADIATAVPRRARLISDVANHAYQNSDFSPYSGQQPEAISRNMQASCILKMVTGNRGELGRALLAKQNPQAANFLWRVEEQAKNVIKRYEGIANDIIDAIGLNMTSNGTLPQGLGYQRLATCFRCAEVGSTTTERQRTNTYVPSFVIPANLLATARMYVAPIYGGVIADGAGGTGVLQIYVQSLKDMTPQFVKLATLYNLTYQPPVLKTTLTTMNDATKFIKVDATGKSDKGVYAATQFQLNYVRTQLTATRFQDGITTPLTSKLAADNGLPGYDPADLPDMYGLMSDNSCDSDATWTPGMVCSNATLLLQRGGDFAPGVVPEPSSDNSTAVAASVGVLVPLAVIGAIVAFVFYRKKKAENSNPAFTRQGTNEMVTPTHA